MGRIVQLSALADCSVERVRCDVMSVEANYIVSFVSDPGAGGTVLAGSDVFAL